MLNLIQEPTEEELEEGLTIDCIVKCPNCGTESEANYNYDGYCSRCRIIFKWKDNNPVWQYFYIKGLDGTCNRTAVLGVN